MKLTKAEEKLMNNLWKLKQAYMRDLLDQYDPPKPATTTLATLLKRMKNKGYVDYTRKGNSRLYFPLVDKSDYYGSQFRKLINSFFGNSAASFASFFTRATDLTKDELEALRKEIVAEIKRKNEES